MPRVRSGDVHLGWREWGEGETTVVFIHGNLASKDWIAAIAPLALTACAHKSHVSFLSVLGQGQSHG
jgi:pimeloyl-ACP methyl ester carboxylesterase